MRMGQAGSGGRESGGTGGWRRVRGVCWGALAGLRGGTRPLIPGPHLGEGAQPAEDPQARGAILEQVLGGAGAGGLIKVKQLSHVEREFFGHGRRERGGVWGAPSHGTKQAPVQVQPWVVH